MRYTSTRGQGGERQFCDILLEGLAPDGGLYLPVEYPSITDRLERWCHDGDLRYADLASEILSFFIDDIDPADIASMCERAYSTPTFSDPEIVPLTKLSSGITIAHTSLGPTAAFKDMAMQLLGELFNFELNRRDAYLTILGATSGDTGSAAEYALLGRDRIKVFMLTPAGRMTPFQQAQMFSIDDPNVVNIAVAGVFDDCQDIVKAINQDAEFKQAHHIGAVNSINWARLLAQVVYYVAAWAKVAKDPSERVSFAVPTGNFGNICAAHIARQMGLPIDKLVLATNENNVLDEFMKTGHYKVRSSEQTFETSSPSMDISKASNFERFIFDLLGRNADLLAKLFGGELAASNEIDLSDHLDDVRGRYGFLSGSSTHADRINTIKEVYACDGVVVDPHTADAITVATRLDVPNTIVMETALPVKFAATINEALSMEPPCPARFAGIEGLPRHVVSAPNDPDAIKALIAG